jgi:hypothetical protein
MKFKTFKAFESSQNIIDNISSKWDKFENQPITQLPDIKNISDKWNKLENQPITQLSDIKNSDDIKKRIDYLFNKGIFVEKGGRRFFKQTLYRLGVIVNVEGIEIPFYQSSQQTGGKTTNWTPFYGNRGGWLIKSTITNINKGLGVPAIQKIMKYLDDFVPEYLLNSGYFTKEQKNIIGNATLSAQLGKLQVQGNTEVFPEVALSQKEVGIALSNLNYIKYDINTAPSDPYDKGASEFVENVENIIRNYFKK